MVSLSNFDVFVFISSVIMGTIVVYFAITDIFFKNENDESMNLKFEIDNLDLMGFLPPGARNGNNDFVVTDIYLRAENNFLQGLYFDSDRRLFYESTGLYGQSRIQKLAPFYPET